MALPVQFRGYRHGFSSEIRDHLDRLTWAVLKGHTRNRAGSVTLRSADPRAAPRVDFRYFDPGDDPEGKDLRAVVDAIGLVRRLTAPLIAGGFIDKELDPGPRDLEEYVRDTAWGHHASCTCAIGTRADDGVIDSAFAVHGARRLRVVDASVFPRIPGFFIVSAVYMIAEKAADAILQAASREPAKT
jgi:choline dehydrogenase-like flavoprotein